MLKLSGKTVPLEQGSLKLLKVHWWLLKWLSFGQLIHKGPGSDPRVAQLSMLSLFFFFYGIPDFLFSLQRSDGKESQTRLTSSHFYNMYNICFDSMIV